MNISGEALGRLIALTKTKQMKHVLTITKIDLEAKTEDDIIQITLPDGVDPYKATPLIMDALAGVRTRKQRSDKGTTKGAAQ